MQVSTDEDEEPIRQRELVQDECYWPLLADASEPPGFDQGSTFLAVPEMQRRVGFVLCFFFVWLRRKFGIEIFFS